MSVLWLEVRRARKCDSRCDLRNWGFERVHNEYGLYLMFKTLTFSLGGTRSVMFAKLGSTNLEPLSMQKMSSNNSRCVRSPVHLSQC